MAMRPGGYLPGMYVIVLLPFFAVQLLGEVTLLRGGHQEAGDGERHRDGAQPGVQAGTQFHGSTRRQ